MSVAAPAATLAARYTAAFPKSRERFATARGVFPNGVTHDVRTMSPFPVYVERAKGATKWSVDGPELIDYFVGHGSLLLGHGPAAVVAAVQEQMTRGTHLGSCHDGEVEWGQLVTAMVPSAEKVRFTGSGTEATLMALRLSRMHTGRPKVLKFLGHFHGWHDAVTIGSDPPYDSPAVAGVPDPVAALTVAIPPNDLGRVEETLRNDDGIGAVILEPTGGHWGAVPVRGEFLRGLREVTARLGRVLIFDEVITGFRVSPGGAQQHYGVTPDLTSLAKILAGGLPGGCLAGKAELLDYIENRPGKPKMRHPGTYNANPLSAAAGIATLKQVRTGTPCVAANRAARELRNRLNTMFEGRGWAWVAYGDFSILRVLPGYDGPRPRTDAGDADGLIPYGGDLNRLDGPKNAAQVMAFRQGMLLNGVDTPGMGFWVSAAHDDETVLARTVTAVERTIDALAAEGLC